MFSTPHLGFKFLGIFQQFRDLYGVNDFTSLIEKMVKKTASHLFARKSFYTVVIHILGHARLMNFCAILD
jgi:hypothetical protein